MKAVLCPVCNGSGKVFPSTASTHTNGEVCHGCDGTGWVSVAEDYPAYVSSYLCHPPYF